MTHHLYQAAGVDLDLARETKKAIFRHARTTFGPGILGDIGAFGGLFHLTDFRDPVLVASTDGVGTKLKLATLMNRFDTIGIDLVNQNLNDIVVLGAKPLFFLDYIGVGKLLPDRVEAVVKGMAEACREAGMALIGGETAQLPGLYQGADFDLVGFIVGAVERAEIINGSRIVEGDVLLGLPSSGLHTNGYSLVRRVFGIDENPRVLEEHYPELGNISLGEALLEPHRSYYSVLREHFSLIKGMAHITGGGLVENVPRVMPQALGARIQTRSWEVPPLFRLIQAEGGVSWEEMYRVFNMGIGMVVICASDKGNQLLNQIKGSVVIGEVVKGEGAILLHEGVY